MLTEYLPRRINSGPWITAYTLPHLCRLPAQTEFVLPVCSVTTPYPTLEALGRYLLPPLFAEALTSGLQARIIDRISDCFPRFGDTAREENARRLRTVRAGEATAPPQPNAKIVAFSVDTAVEEHGPHLPLATDTVQSYAVLQALAEHEDGIYVARPLDYGQLTWGLPFGFSIDLTAELLTDYVAGYANYFSGTYPDAAVYVVDVHGSITHRQAIVEGLKRSRLTNWAFRWLHQPLAEFASARGDQHAGGVETALVEYINPHLLDPAWWPQRIDEIAAEQMSFEKAVELTPDLAAFMRHVRDTRANGVIGNILNYRHVDASSMFSRMLQTAKDDLATLMNGVSSSTQDAGQQCW